MKIEEEKKLLEKVKKEQKQENGAQNFLTIDGKDSKSQLTWSFEIMELDNRVIKTTMNTLENIAVNQYMQYWNKNQHYNPLLPL